MILEAGSFMNYFSYLPIWFTQILSIDQLIAQWEVFGVFDFVLPFLLIFAVIFGVLTSTNILGSNKGINLIISLVIALMALRLGFVQDFFFVLFPRLGVALAVILVTVILIGVFIPSKGAPARGWFIFLGIIAAIIAFITILQSFGALGFFGSSFWQQYASIIVTAIFVIFVLVVIVVTVSPKKSTGEEVAELLISPFRK